MHDKNLEGIIEAVCDEFRTAGIAVGVLVDGRESFACTGVTSLENPLAVDADTLFLIGSMTKTFTATTAMTLIAEGRLALDAPVASYLPELELADSAATREVTILQLLNHTSGLDWGLIDDFGEGDDALARYVARAPELAVLSLPGTRTSYSQAAFNILGRVIERVTDLTFEEAVRRRILAPLDLTCTFFERDDIMTRRFAVGHNLGESGELEVARMWRRSRGDNPGGGLASSASDLLRWAAFHLGQTGAERILSLSARQAMQLPTAELRGSNLGEAIGLGWFLRHAEGVAVAGHAGSANGQFAELVLLPSRRFAAVVLCNAGPDGVPLNQTVVREALGRYLGLTEREPEAAPFDPLVARELVGRYENDVMELDVTQSESGLGLEVRIRPELRASSEREMPPDYDPFEFSLLADRPDEYIITAGAFKSQRGYFTRGAQDEVTGIDLAGRLFRRADPGPAPDAYAGPLGTVR